MTTIACDGMSVAGDGQITSENGLVSHSRFVKVHRLPDGAIVGFSGHYADIAIALRWMQDGGDRPCLSDDFEALKLDHDGIWTADHHLEWLKEEGPIAIGSGCRYAIGAMDAGATAEEAVEVACQRDDGTGGEITVLAL